MSDYSRYLAELTKSGKTIDDSICNKSSGIGESLSLGVWGPGGRGKGVGILELKGQRPWLGGGEKSGDQSRGIVTSKSSDGGMRGYVALRAPGAIQKWWFESAGSVEGRFPGLLQVTPREKMGQGYSSLDMPWNRISTISCFATRGGGERANVDVGTRQGETDLGERSQRDSLRLGRKQRT